MSSVLRGLISVLQEFSFRLFLLLLLCLARYQRLIAVYIRRGDMVGEVKTMQRVKWESANPERLVQNANIINLIPVSKGACFTK